MPCWIWNSTSFFRSSQATAPLRKGVTKAVWAPTKARGPKGRREGLEPVEDIAA